MKVVLSHPFLNQSSADSLSVAYPRDVIISNIRTILYIPTVFQNFISGVAHFAEQFFSKKISFFLRNGVAKYKVPELSSPLLARVSSQNHVPFFPPLVIFGSTFGRFYSRNRVSHYHHPNQPNMFHTGISLRWQHKHLTQGVFASKEWRENCLRKFPPKVRQWPVASAGVFAAVITHPVDTVKTRALLDDPLGGGGGFFPHRPPKKGCSKPTPPNKATLNNALSK